MTKHLPSHFAILSILLVSTCALSRDDSPRLAIATGAFTSFHRASSGVGILEYRAAYNLLSGETYLNPIAGFLANTDDGIYGYAGLRLGFPFSSSWHWENALGFGAYSRGNGPDLHDPLEFCFAIAITRQIHGATRVGLELFHISNAGLRVWNPGANSFVALIEFGL